jgi:acyl-CoA synthetase (NDP forming)
VVVISSGFAEASAAGRQAEQRVRHLVRAAGMRLVGPNCMGLLNTAPTTSLNATFAPLWPPAGNIGMLSQSGALGLAILDYVHTLIVLYLESFGNPRKFARIAPEVARHKPIVAVKAGRSAAGTRAASSHSAALASLDVAVEALFAQAGVLRTNTLEELFEVAALLALQPVPQGPRVGVVTNAGGPGILLADACEAHGLALPALSPETRAVLRTWLPAQAGLSNPVDMMAAATPAHYARTIEAVGADPQIDAVVVIYIPPLVTNPEESAHAIAQGAGTVPAHKPVLTVFISSRGAPPALSTGPRGKLPSYTFPENAAQALAASVRYRRWRERPQGTPFTLSPFAHSAVRAVIDRVLTNAKDPLWLAQAELVTVLRAVGMECAVAEQTTPADAVATAARLGYPLVAKAISPDVLHKSDVGGVIMGLDSADAVAAAVNTLVDRLQRVGARLDGMLLQREVSGGLEALVGVTTDPTLLVRSSEAVTP